MRSACLWFFGIWVVTAVTTITPCQAQYANWVYVYPQQYAPIVVSAGPSQVPAPVAESTEECYCQSDECILDSVDGVCSRIFVQTDALFLDRVPSLTHRPLVLDTAGHTLLETQDLNLPFAAGARVVFGVRPDANGHGGEVVYFGLHDWQEAITVTSPNDLRLPGDLPLLTTDFLQADQMQVDYTAQLHNAEINALYQGGRASWLVGFRYINLDERFNIHASDLDTAGSDYRIETWNNLFGGQVDARVVSEGEKFGWDLTGKAGIFANDCGQRTFLGDFGNTFVFRDSSTLHVQTAMDVDLSWSAFWRFNDTWSVRGGYNLMWVYGLALAPDQLDFSTALDDAGKVAASGGVLLHGATSD